MIEGDKGTSTYGRWINEAPTRDGDPDEDCILRLCHIDIAEVNVDAG